MRVKGGEREREREKEKEGGGHGVKDRGLTCCRRIRRTCVAVERTDGIHVIVAVEAEARRDGTREPVNLARARDPQSFTVPFKNVLIIGEVPRS